MATQKSRQLQTAILTDEETLNTLDKLAAREQLSRSDIIRRALRQYIESELRERPLEEVGTESAA